MKSIINHRLYDCVTEYCASSPMPKLLLKTTISLFDKKISNQTCYNSIFWIWIVRGRDGRELFLQRSLWHNNTMNHTMPMRIVRMTDVTVFLCSTTLDMTRRWCATNQLRRASGFSTVLFYFVKSPLIMCLVLGFLFHFLRVIWIYFISINNNK